MASLLDTLRSPFRMQPGLRRMADHERHLHPLEPGSSRWQEKQAVVQAGQALHCVPGFDASDAINTLASRAVASGIFAHFDSATPLALRVAEDLAVLEADGRVPWMCVCLPSHWAPEDKLGQSLAQIHGPVADAAALQAAMPALASLVTAGACWERGVWTITPSPRLDQHPRRQPRVPWPDGTRAALFAQGCWLRSERQTFFPVRRPDGRLAGQAVFTIRVQTEPLVQAVRTPTQARHLAAALGSMSEAVLAYKGLTGARAPLLRWLDGLAALRPPA